MKRFSSAPARRAILLASLSSVVAPPLPARADGTLFPETVETSHCGTPPESRAEVVRGPRLGLDAATGEVVRRHAAVPRYPCADAPRGPEWGVDAIEILIEAPRARRDPRAAPR